MDADDAVAILVAEGAGPARRWGNGPGDRYAAHSHPYKKILCCLEGSIVFHMGAGDTTLTPGQRLVVEPGVEHSATVGLTGVRCAEAHVT